MTRLGIIGGGNMSEAVLAGIIKTKLLAPERITVSDVKEERLEHLAKRYGVKTTRDNLIVMRESDTVILAVKPQQMKEVLDEVAQVSADHLLIISMAAGIPIRYIESRLGRSVPVIRVMPNAPALVRETAAAIAMGSSATTSHRDMVMALFNAIGQAVAVSEDQMDAVTALSGSGPAYVCSMVEAMVEAGVAEGITEDVARELVIQTVYGTAHMLGQTLESPDLVCKRVASPGGTTEAGMKVLDEKNWKAILKEAIHAARVRAEELAESA